MSKFLKSNLVGEYGELGDATLIPQKSEGGGSAEVTPASIVRATGQMTYAQKADTRANLGAVSSAVMGAVYERLEALEGTTVTVDGTTPTITPEDNHDYQCGELDSLTISNPPASGKYSIIFTSGATPTQAIIPPKPAMRWQTDDNEPPQGFPAANTRYEINVVDTYVVLGEWPVPEVSA